MSAEFKSIQVEGFRSAVTGELFIFNCDTKEFVSENEIDWVDVNLKHYETAELTEEALEILETNGFVGALKLFQVDTNIPYTYDVVFHSETSDNQKGFDSSKEYCIDYIKTWNGSNESYFADYKGGTVVVKCNETEEVVYEETVR